MILTPPAHDTVHFVTHNMRARDREEIYGLRFTDNPFVITNEVMAQPSFAWVAWHDRLPAAVFGGMERHPGVWSMFAFGTDSFGHIARPLTRFAKTSVIPRLWELGAHRLQADSHEKHREAHLWLERLGARRESVRVAYGRNGSNYFHYVLAKSVDLCESQE